VKFLRHVPGEGYHFEIPSSKGGVHKILIKGKLDSSCSCGTFIYMVNQWCEHMYGSYFFLTSNGLLVVLPNDSTSQVLSFLSKQ
jgi:hypothetical protein